MRRRFPQAHIWPILRVGRDTAWRPRPFLNAWRQVTSYQSHRLRYLGMANTRIRPASAADASAIAAVLEMIVAERVHSAIERVWTVDEERRYLESLSPREALHVAVDADQGIIGFQSLDLWAPLLTSM